MVAPAKTATNPIPAKSATGKGKKSDKALPKVAPIKNNGVTSPPLKPAPKVNPVNKILSRSTDPQLAFGNDADDMRSPGGGIDPRVNVNDHTNDMVTYGEDRFKLINTMMPKLKTRFSKPNQSYQELRMRYMQLNGQRSSMASALSRYIGGVYVDRSFVGQQTNSAPFTPVPVDYQKNLWHYSINMYLRQMLLMQTKIFFLICKCNVEGLDFSVITKTLNH